MTVDNGMKIANYQRPVNLLEMTARNVAEKSTEKTGKREFKEMFSRELAQSRQVNFSRHASQRLFSRGIELSEDLLNRVADAIDKAEQKGARETLIMTDETALVVATRNRTVVTVFDRDNLREGVITAIDSAVIL